jgi:hypothetical protein
LRRLPVDHIEEIEEIEEERGQPPIRVCTVSYAIESMRRSRRNSVSPPVGRQMQVGEQLLLGAEPVIFLRYGLLDFDDQVCSGGEASSASGRPTGAHGGEEL